MEREQRGRGIDRRCTVSAAEVGAARFDVAVDIVLNSGPLAPFMEHFWAFVDGDESEAMFRYEMLGGPKPDDAALAAPTVEEKP